MALREIQIMGDKVLRERARPVETVTEDTRRLVRDMFDTMYDAGGIGLAAPQVGVSERVLVVDVPDEDGARHRHALVDPVVADRGETIEKAVEGCLSIPGIEELVARPARVVVEGLDTEGAPVQVEAEGLLARALQHEIDHLDGVLFIDRLSQLKRSLLLRKWRKLRSGAG